MISFALTTLDGGVRSRIACDDTAMRVQPRSCSTAFMNAPDSFPPTRAEGLRRLTAFVPHAGRAYAEGRNADHGAGNHAAVSQLSPYLRYRLITEAEVVAAVLAVHKPAAAEKYVQEVLWRTYWKGWLELRPAAWTRFVTERDAARDGAGGGLLKALAAAEGGTTGIDGFDNWARELVATGYLHNHARMWFASIWIFTLRLPWTLGADFFLRHLIDADPASNTLSWRWVAGLQTVGKTYLATADNIARYTGGRFAPTGLATRAEALTEPPLGKAAALVDLPVPALGRALLLITPDDMSAETLSSSEFAAVVVARGDDCGDWPWGDAARKFITAAADDAARRAGAAFGVAATTIDTLDAAAIAAAARTASVTTVVAVEAPIGPVADALARCDAALAADGIRLVRRRREWDATLWPLATKGYFAFRERTPELLARGLLTA